MDICLLFRFYPSASLGGLEVKELRVVVDEPGGHGLVQKLGMPEQKTISVVLSTGEEILKFSKTTKA